MAHNAQQNKGTLVPGQTISVNKYTVQVDRYLSQGGFAHVYLVRTATPVYNTTRHVLKRIAVPNEAMLTEVKREVDIMRILKGHSNIVHLIDAAWHRMPNGVYEVFILMEFCSGGGIIDMMNRRLRERLTEAEILQIFVDVCEGVASMHNLRPPLLHRDLKVENILQSSDTLFKLCDFGSAAPVAPRPPSNTQEIRALEADLNRHTTLQYRAPEMVDVYLRRPVDEKSDVWALGVLLYKLCYYTTPFEEHGPLAILNVQYKIPSYPVYSSQINNLIASMLREHGAQRPSVFEVLNTVHQMRGTKSRFTYAVPQRPVLSPRHEISAQSNPLDSLISYRTPPIPQFQKRAPSPAKNAGVQAREKVLEAIAPMRRGRPAALSRPSSPEKEKENRTTARAPGEFTLDFGGAQGDDSWRQGKNAGGVRGHRSGLASPGVWGAQKSPVLDDAWDVGRAADKDKDKDRRKTFQSGLDPAFTKGFGDAFDGMLGSSSSAASASASGNAFSSSIPIPRPTGTSSFETNRPAMQPSKSKDAFDGLGLLPTEKVAPTLGEARMMRTGQGLTAPARDYGLSSSPSHNQSLNIPASSPRPNASSPRPNAYSPRPSPSPLLPSQAPSPVPPTSTSWKPAIQLAQPHAQQQRAPPSPSSMSAEERYPSLEDLDQKLLSPVQVPPPSQTNSLYAAQPARRFTGATTGGGLLGPSGHGALGSKFDFDGVRSEHVTGAAMRESREARRVADERERERVKEKESQSDREAQKKTERELAKEKAKEDETPTKLPRLASRPMPPRKQRSAVTLRSPSADVELQAPAKETQLFARADRPRDWLTGSDELEEQRTPPQPGTPVLRDSPSKRASVVARGPLVQSPQEAVADTRAQPKQQQQQQSWRQPSPEPKIGAWRSMGQQTPVQTGVGGPSISSPQKQKPVPKPKPVDLLVLAPVVQTTPTASEPLSENWSPVAPPKTASTVSSGDEGPEDAVGFHGQKVFDFSGAVEKTGQGKRRERANGRQSSVHDLVDLWGGAVGADREKEEVPRGGPSRFMTGNGLKDAGRERESQAMSKTLQPPAAVTVKPRTASPEPFFISSASPEPPLRSQSPTKDFARQRKSSATGLSSMPFPSSPGAAPGGRSRPQSMFISSPSTPKTPIQPQTDPEPTSALGLPEPDARARRSGRRTSISDMVLRYEAMGGKPIVPAPSAKPIARVATHGTSTSILSGRVAVLPSAQQATRTRSQFAQGASLAVRDEDTRDVGKNRTSPTGLPRTSPVGLPGLASDKRPPMSTNNSSSSSAFSGSRRPSSRQESLPVRPVAVYAQPAPASPNDESPPERPYQGVGKLIDQWQRKTAADPEPPRSPSAKRGSAFGARRVGVVNGRGQQS